MRDTPAPRLSTWFRYAGVSVVAAGLAQAGLAIGYGWLRWPVPASVLLSLAVSAGPAYCLNRWLVWPRQGRWRPSVQLASFLAVALIGSLLTIGFIDAALAVARTATSNRGWLTITANVASILATGVVWIGRFFVLDRMLFRPRVSAAAVEVLT